MIVANKLALLTNMPPVMLTEGIRRSGHKKDKFETAEFLGLSNGNEFVYSVSYAKGNELITAKVFVKYDPTLDKVIVDY